MPSAASRASCIGAGWSRRGAAVTASGWRVGRTSWSSSTLCRLWHRLSTAAAPRWCRRSIWKDLSRFTANSTESPRPRRSAEQAPWLYEAWQLQGDVYLEQATAQRDRGEYPEAEVKLRSAVTMYELAADVGRSDASIYHALAEAWIPQSQVDSDQGRSPQAALAKALLACEKASTAAPRDATGYTKKAYSYFWLAWDALVSGKDPRPEVERLVEQAAQAVRHPYVSVKAPRSMLADMSSQNVG